MSMHAASSAKIGGNCPDLDAQDCYGMGLENRTHVGI
jgi:hypothetical protein